MKKIVLNLVFILSILLVQSAAFANGHDIYLIAYMNKLQNKVKSNWVLPHGQNGKKAIITFEVDQKGNIVKPSVLTSSGDKQFDEEALNATRFSSPFDNLPPTYKENSLVVNFTFSQENFKAEPILKALSNNSDIQIINQDNSNGLQKTGSICENQVIKIDTVDKDSENNSDFKPYINYLQSDIKSNWYPLEFKGKKRAVAFFRIGRSGELKKVKIFKSSGDRKFDNEALNAVHQSAPFSPLPKEFKGSTVDVLFTFDFNYTTVKTTQAKQNEKQISPVVFNHSYYAQSDMSSPLVKLWAIDRVAWLSYLILHICAHGI